MVKASIEYKAPQRLSPVKTKSSVKCGDGTTGTLSYRAAAAFTHNTRPGERGTCLEANRPPLDDRHTPNFYSLSITTMANAATDAPVVPILLVGDNDVGKSAFLSYVNRCRLMT
jgi:hypothetical protein